MDISKAKKLVELTKGDRKILVTIYEGGQVSSCIEDEAKKSYCETCQADDETCRQWIEHLKSQGYEATEIELGDLEIEESLPKFLSEREISAEPEAVVEREEQVVTSEDVGKVEEILEEPEGDEHAVSGTFETLPGSGETLSEGG